MRKIIYISVFMTTILIVGMTFIPIVQTSDYTKKLKSNMATKIPTIDGSITSGEWDDAYDNTVTVGTIAGTHIHIKNTATMLYMLIVISDDQDSSDWINLRFDEENDEVFKSYEMGGEDGKKFSADGSIYDEFNEGSSIFYDTSWSGTLDGSCSWSYGSGSWNIELAIPISYDGDPYDVNIHSGSAIGFFLRYHDASGDIYHYWPTSGLIGTQSTWGNICTALTYEGYIPHADDTGAWRAYLSVANTGHATSTVILQFADGTIATRTVAAGQSTKGFVSSFKGSSYVGPIKIWSNQSFTALLNQEHAGLSLAMSTVVEGKN